MKYITMYLSLAKPRVLALMGLTALGTAVVAARGGIPLSAGLYLTLAILLGSAGAAYLNNFMDRDIDAIMERTRARPLPRGAVRPGLVFLIGLVLIAVSIPLALQLNYLVAIFVTAGAVIYSLVYTLWLKRRTSMNIVIGGVAGSCAVLAGWYAVGTGLSSTPVLLALLVFLWTPSHFWSLAMVHRDSYQEARVPMLPVAISPGRTATYIVLSSVLLLICSVVIYFTGDFHGLYLVGAIVLGVLFLASCVRLWKRPVRDRAWLNFKLSGVYLLGLFLVLMLDVTIY